MHARYSEYKYWIWTALAICTMSLHSCNTAKYMAEGETLLEQNELNFQSPDKIQNKDLLLSQLDAFVLQKPNGSFAGIPFEWIYYINSQEDDTKWYNKFARKHIGEKPAIYDHGETLNAADQMGKYLRNKKGFFHASVAADTTQKGHKTYVEYDINAGRRSYINSLKLIGKDTNIVQILQKHQAKSLLAVGQPLDASTFDLEKTRMVNLLQNMGYANFAPNYIDIKGDSTGLDHKVDIFLEIYPPAPGQTHKKYTVGHVNVVTDYFRGISLDSLYSEDIGGYTFYSGKERFIVSPELLLNKIALKPGQTVRKDDQLSTYNQLSKLGSYRFVSINSYLKDPQDTLINFDILLTAHKNRWFADFGADMFYSSISAANLNILGFSVNSAFTNRNALGGSERLTISAEIGQELELNPVRSRTTSISLQSALVVPREVNLLGYTELLRGLRIISAERQKRFKEQAQTTFSLGGRIQRIREFYDETEIGGSYGFSYNDTRRNLSIRQVAINLNISSLKQRFLDQIMNRPAIIKSFDNYLTTGFVLRDITYNYNSRKWRNGFSWAYILNAGQSGFETWAANKVYNAIANKTSEWRIGGEEGVNFAKFVKLSLDLRGNKDITEKSMLATRIYIGIIKPFGGDVVVPFNEQYSVGGPTSLRGWDQQELGPGGYQLESNEPNQLFYQKGDIKLELNAEYRFHISKIPFSSGKVQGGLFVDAGNIWLHEYDLTREDAQFTSNFYKQIAIAAGWGLRFDFDYFLIRFDFGYKLRTPYANEYGNHWRSFNQVRKQGTLGFGNLQVAINQAF